MVVPQPPTRLTAGRVVLERARDRHVEGIHTAVVRSRAELRAFMDWMTDEPRTLDQSAEFIGMCDEQWVTGEAYNYVMTDPETGEVIGVCGLMTRAGPRRLEIGYWVRSDRAGAGVATAAATLLTEAGFGVAGIDIVEIHHDAANVASGRIPEKLGYLEVVRRDVEIDSPGECGIEVIWEMARADWLNSPARP